MSHLLSRAIATSSFCVIVFIGFIAGCGITTAQDQDQLPQTWRKRILEETKRFSDWSKSHMTSYSSSVTMNRTQNGKSLTLQAQQIIKRKGPFYLQSSEGRADDSTIPSFCYGINSKYGFELNKSKKGRDWVVAKVINLTEDFDEKQLTNIAFQGGSGLRNFIDMLFNKGVTVKLISDNSDVEPGRIEELPGFRLDSMSIDGPRQNIFRVNFDYEVSDAERKKGGIAHCQLEFDLEAQCYPVKSHQVLKTGAEETLLDWSHALTQKTENQYELKSFSCVKKTLNSVVTQFEEVKEEAILYFDDLPESDFTLSAFGLPEPPGVEWKKPFPWYLVFGIIGTVCLGVFFFLRARGRGLRGS